MDPKLVTPVLIAAVIAWGIYRRVRRTFGRQRVRPRSLWIRIGTLGVLGVAVGVGAVHDIPMLGGLVAGCAAGAVLAGIGLRFTRFEVTPEGRFYTAHVYTGVAVTALFVVRLLYDLTLHDEGTMFRFSAAAYRPPTLEHGPLTLAFFGAFVGYYVVYYLGVFRGTRPSSLPARDDATQGHER